MLNTRHLHQYSRVARRAGLGVCELPVRVAALCGLLLILVWFAPAAFAADPGDAEFQFPPSLVAPGDVIGLEQGERLLLKQEILERALEEGSSDYHQLRKLLGAKRCRELSRAQFMFDLYAEHLGRDPRDDPRFEDAKDAVFSAWKKIQRERLEEALGIEAWWNKRRAGFRRGRDQGEGEESQEKDSSWRLRVSPRFSDDAVGFRLNVRGTDSYLDHLTFRFRYDLDESHPVFIFKFEDHFRLLDFFYEPDTRKFGDRLGVSLRYSW